MSGNIFPVKLLHIVTEMSRRGLLAAHGPAVQSPDDGKTRFILCSPEVQRAVGRTVEDPRNTRVRLAVPADHDIVSLSDGTMLELYDFEGAPLGAPRPVTGLNEDLSNAIQVELFHTLLRSHGSSIPLL
ncbi:hypothetical protein D3C71_24530 [compost metagenome]